MDEEAIGDDRVDFNPEAFHQPSEFGCVMVAVEGEGREADDIDGGLGGFFGADVPGFAGFCHVELDNLLQGPIGGLKFVVAIVVDVGEEHIAFAVKLGAFDEVVEVFLQNARGAGGSQDDEVGGFFFILADDVVHDFFLGATSEDVAIDDAGGDGGEVFFPFKHRSHDVEVVVAQGRMHDRVDVFEGAGDAESSDVGRSGVHPVGEFHGRGAWAEDALA